MNNATPLLEVQDLKQYFSLPGNRILKAVNGVSFCVEQGETLGLVGESGCGKSTLGRTLLHLYRPTGGRILFQGTPVSTPEEIRRFRRQTAMVFQDPYACLNPRMTVADIIAEPLDVQKRCASAQQRREAVLELMAKVGLNAEHANRYAHQFSGGQRQRIGIARALAIHPRFLVCDEPVSALDVSIQAQIINLFSHLQEEMGLTCLFIAHDLLVVRHICRRIAVMYLGKMVELAPAEDLFCRPVHPYTQCLISAVPVPDPEIAEQSRRIVLKGDVPSPVNVPSGCPFHTRCPYATQVCREQMPPFQEISPGHFSACHHPSERKIL